MFSHQYVNSIGNDLYNCYWYKNAQWNLHYHRGYEFVWVTAGELRAHVAGRDHLLHKGDALFVTPYQLHSYTTDKYSESYITVFSKSFVGKFASAIATKEPIDAKFTVSEPLAAYLRGYMTKGRENIDHGKTTVYLKKPDFFFTKACLYAICAEFFSVAEWKEKKEKDELVFKIISYIEKHYTDDITLYTMADALSYEYHYISRVLKENLNIRFRTLVNEYRCERARELISETDEPLSAIAMNCGFQSIRSFNRVFYEIMGATPTEVRKGTNKK